MITQEQRVIFERWVIGNVDETVVPGDEGNSQALIYNLVHLIRGDGIKYDYQGFQDKEIESWNI